MHAPASHARTTIWLLITGIIFIAANLRAPLTSVGPLVGMIRENLSISNTLAGLITTVPLLAFAILSTFIPRLGRKYGIERVILFSLVVLTIGIVIRSLSGVVGLFAGTAILGMAITIGNVLLPSLIKRAFPQKLGMMTGVYSVSMNLCGAVASGISIPLAVGAGLQWQGALGIWALLAIVSILLWIPQFKAPVKPVASSSRTSHDRQVNLWRSALAWKITLFMGIQSTFFYVLVAWLPEILIERGVQTSQAGWYLSILIIASLPFAFIVPVLAGRMRDQRSLVILTSVMFLIGTIGLLYSSLALLSLWVIILGVGVGFAFSLSMMFFGLRTRGVHQAAELSGMAQSVGYLLAALGPALFGYVHDVTHSWNAPLWILVIAAALIGIIGLGAANNQYVEG